MSDNSLIPFPVAEAHHLDQEAPEPGRCNRHNRQGFLCRQPAGWGTIHPGTGACKLHGGRTALGLSSEVLNSVLGEKIEMYRNNPDRMRLDDIIAAMRALADHWMSDEENANYDKALMALGQVASAVKAQNDILYRKTGVSVDQVKELLNDIVGILKEELRGYPDLLESIGARIHQRLVMTTGEVIEA